MGEYLFRGVATIFIWMMVAGISITTIMQSNYGIQSGEGIVIIMSMIVGAIATGAIWKNSGNSSQEPQNAQQRLEKAKRGAASGNSKLALLMEMMDDNEREAFKDTLKQRLLDEAVYGSSDGESLSLETLLEEEARYDRRY